MDSTAVLDAPRRSGAGLPAAIALPRAAFRLTGFVLLTLFVVTVAQLGWLLRVVGAHAAQWRFGVSLLHRYARAAAWLFGLRLSVRGRRPEPGALVAANHHSYLDIVALAAIQPMSFLSKREVSRWPLIGWAALAFGIPFVHRAVPDSRRRAADAVLDRLDAGLTVVNFPEGTTTAGARPLPFRPGLFARVVGRPIRVVPTTIRYASADAYWVGQDTFIRHLAAFASRRRTDVEVLFSPDLDASRFEDGEALADAAHALVSAPLPASVDPDRELGWLARPWLRDVSFTTHGGRYRIRVLDQPGRWMVRSDLAALVTDLRAVAREGMEEAPTYGVFTGRRSALANRVIAVAYDAATGQPAAFTAMVYLPVRAGGRVETVVHLGLTIIGREHRGQRLQTPLFRKLFLLPIANQRRLDFVITSIAASPAGVGAASDYFFDTYPHYAGLTRREPHHLAVAEQVLRAHRHEFGCSARAAFDPETFVVHRSNEPGAGGAWQFIKDDPVSRYRVDACNDFCIRTLDYTAGDELFQVGRASVLRSLWVSRAARRGT